MDNCTTRSYMDVIVSHWVFATAYCALLPNITYLTEGSHRSKTLDARMISVVHFQHCCSLPKAPYTLAGYISLSMMKHDEALLTP
ncbi:hypothetical protein EJ05DRAFT_88098 [Pseudovirgaria hyperparasitica]|uniref:Uncharacterized protein n=1 Tax=Pseudovirgaria hyperparasitica TaxID=470096 RepID=A0A6A6W0L9_9PEZI|nr:uncharacterized protein EJ05DRAFT_88098 [Pseudovirgaria hyperparasitica]KAF2756055.1 hypothetical protein EJ05DRAFT_88098 [Pseudovirgaria hyperparasitica]